MTQQEKAARRYCREQLAIMDGSFQKALRRIGTEGYEQLVRDVLKGMPKQKKRARQ